MYIVRRRAGLGWRDEDQRLRRAFREGAARSLVVRAPGHRPARRRHRHPLLRGLPFRPPHRPQRVAGDRLPVRPRARDRRPGRGSRRGGEAIQARRAGRGGLHRGLLPAAAPTAARGWSSSATRSSPGPTTAPTSTWAASPTAATRSASWSTSTSCCGCPTGSIPPRVAPLLCAGITTYSPLRHWKAGKGKKVGIVGLGGLGHMGVKLAHALGAEVVLFTTSPGQARGRAPPGRLGRRRLAQRGRDGAPREQLRLHPRHRLRAPRPRGPPRAPEARRHPHPRGRAARAAHRQPLPPRHAAPPAGRLAHRRDSRDPGDARFLRGAAPRPPTSRSSRSRTSRRPTPGW